VKTGPNCQSLGFDFTAQAFSKIDYLPDSPCPAIVADLADRFHVDVLGAGRDDDAPVFLTSLTDDTG